MAKKRNYRCQCKGCKFKGTSPTSMHTHYKENPSHAPNTSVMSPEALASVKKRKSPRQLSMAPKDVRNRERTAAIKAGDKLPDRRKRENRIIEPPKTKKTRRPALTGTVTRTGCNFCPQCGLFLGPVNTGFDISTQKD